MNKKLFKNVLHIVLRKTCFRDVLVFSKNSFITRRVEQS